VLNARKTYAKLRKTSAYLNDQKLLLFNVHAFTVTILLLCLGRERSIAIGLFVCESLCVHLSVREHISGTTGLIFTKFCMQIPCGHGSVTVWQHCDTLCTSGFMDDVMFRSNGSYGDAWTAAPQPTTASSIAIPGRSLRSINALFILQ